MESQQQDKYLLIGDIGGTNSRYQLKRITDKVETILVKHYKTQETPSFGEGINQFIKDAGVNPKQISAGVFGICGPIDEGGVISVLANVGHWGKLKETEIEEQTKISKIKFLNDFVAHGYGMLGLEKEQLVTLYEPIDGVKEDHVRLAIGVGTGLGLCYIARENPEQTFEVYASESGMVKRTQYNKFDREFEKFLTEEKHIQRKDIEVIIGGTGFPLLFEYLAKIGSVTGNYKSQLLNDKSLDQIKGQDITQYAKEHNDPLCLDVIKTFSEYLAKYLCDLALTFLPYGGIYLTSSIVLSMEFLFEQQEFKDRFLEVFQNRGSLTDVLKTIPIYLVKYGELAERGCVVYAQSNNLI